MIERIIEWSMRNRFLVISMTILLVGLGIRSVFKTPVDAIPDLFSTVLNVTGDLAAAAIVARQTAE